MSTNVPASTVIPPTGEELHMPENREEAFALLATLKHHHEALNKETHGAKKPRHRLVDVCHSLNITNTAHQYFCIVEG